MKQTLTIIIMMTLAINLSFAQDMEKKWKHRNQNIGQENGQGMHYGKDEAFKNLSPEEKAAKRQERYESASPEQKARMDENRKLRMEEAAQLGFDISTEEGRAKFHEYRIQNNQMGQKQGMGKGKGKGKGMGKGQGKNCQ